MGLQITTRASDSPWIDVVWTSTSADVREMTSVATARWGLVFWEQDGRRFAAVTGPETSTGHAPVPQWAQFVGIEFAIGTFLRDLPVPALVDGGVDLPGTTRTSFRLVGSRWEIPGPDDAEALVDRLVRDGVLVRDPLVAEVLRGRRPPASERTLERRFRAATGLTRGAVHRIERARAAAHLIAAGKPPAEVAAALGFYDQPHLARALRRYVGRTANELRSGTGGALALDLPQTTS